MIHNEHITVFSGHQHTVWFRVPSSESLKHYPLPVWDNLPPLDTKHKSPCFSSETHRPCHTIFRNSFR